MTREISKHAIDHLPGTQLAKVVTGFGFLKASALRAGVPHADSWQLDHQPADAEPWRVIDRDADPGPTSRVALTFQSVTIAGLRIEMRAYAKALRGINAIHRYGFSSDLMAATRQRLDPMP